MFGDMGMGGSIPSPACSVNSNMPNLPPPTVSPNLANLSPGARNNVPPGVSGSAMAAMVAMAATGGTSGAGGGGVSGGGPGAHGGMKLPRYMPHVLQQQMFGGVDPRMMMMMGRGMPPSAAAAAMMRNPMHPFRPRFM